MGKDKSVTFCSTIKCQCLMLLLTVGSVAIVVCVALLSTSVRTRIPPDMDWWKTTIIYQIYPRSFMDSNGDGVGDLRGIIDKMDYFSYLNVKAIWISPAYESPMKDFGYDISNFTNIDPIFGDLDDMENLINEAHKKGVRVILDFVPNHSSDQCMWFNRSVAGDPKYRDYYIWENGTMENGVHKPPNNWLSVFKNSAWEWSDERQQYYYHAFLKAQPDLNYRNEEVVKEMQDVLRFWLKRGVDGFRIDALANLFEVTNVSLNEPPSNNSDYDDTQWESLIHIHTQNQLDDLKRILAGWRSVLDEFEKDGKPRFMVVEAYTQTIEERNYWYKTSADMPFNFALITDLKGCGGSCFNDLVQKGYEDLPKGAWPNFVLGNHDNHRISARKGEDYVDVLNMMLLTLWGTPTTYYGEEIGMLNVAPTFAETVDPNGKQYNESGFLKFTRDLERSPMQWSDTISAGFSNITKTWLPVGKNYPTINVESEENTTYSSIKLYSTLAKLREEPSFTYGKIDNVVVDDNIFSYLRHAKGFTPYLVILNLGNSTTTDDYSGDPVNAESGVVAATTGNTTYNIDEKIGLTKIKIDPAQGLVIKI